MWQVVRSLRASEAIILTHYLDEVEEMADGSA
jgi:ABC-type multidrug transport system ATPase subunit